MPRSSDEQDSTSALWANYVLAALIFLGILGADILQHHKGWNSDLLDSTVVGMLIGFIGGWIGAVNGYFFGLQKKGEEKPGGKTP